MSEQLSFDRAKGFVALPVEVLEIEMTPGAFRLLAELCRMANLEGYCWPSLDQLSERMGRSRSAISGYIKELRTAALVDTETQTTANGYNYRLKYRVTFWAEWRASLNGSTRRKTEHRVQSDERLKESKNHNYQNHCLPAAEIDRLLKDWSQCFAGAPYPMAYTPPSEQLMISTTVELSQRPAPDISADISDWLGSFWEKNHVDVPARTVADQVRTIMKTAPSHAEFTALTKAISHAWKPHWKRPPDETTFAKILQSARVTTTSQKRALLKSYQNRWRLAQKTLRSPTHSGSVPETKKAAA